MCEKFTLARKKIENFYIPSFLISHEKHEHSCDKTNSYRSPV